MLSLVALWKGEKKIIREEEIIGEKERIKSN
jgi:hypothetical protein